MSIARAVYGVVLLAMVGVLGLRVLAMGANARADADPPKDNPVDLLATAPLEGQAFAELAVASQAGTDPAATRKLHEIAVRRDPRDIRVRAWLADAHLKAGDYRPALEHIDVILRLSPEARDTLPPMLVSWAGDPAFAEALVDVLRARPAWRRQMDKALRADIQEPGAGAVFAGLAASGDLDEAEVSRWLEALMRVGNWGLAYSYWVSGLDLGPGEPLAMLYNGGFEQPASQAGFDWRTERRAGSYTNFEPAAGANGRAAHLVFHGRPVAYANLEQALALAPGRYAVSMRVKAMALRTDQGLQWTVSCHGQARPLAAGAPIDGTFEWRRETLEFVVPPVGCPGQWLRLANPAPQGAARIVAGEAWIDDMALRPLSPVAAVTEG